MGYFPNIEHPLWKGDCKWCLSGLLGKRIIGISSLSPRHDDLVDLSNMEIEFNHSQRVNSSSIRVSYGKRTRPHGLTCVLLLCILRPGT
jgi:hypothetical protein